MRRLNLIKYLALLFFVIQSCSQNNLNIKNTTWATQNSIITFTVDSDLNAESVNTHSKGDFKLQYKLIPVTDDSLIFKSTYKDSLMTAGYFKLLNQNEAIFCRYKLHPNKSGNIDYFIYYSNINSNKTSSKTTKITFPKKEGRYVIEFLDSEINNTYSQNREYNFKENHLQVDHKLYPKEITSNSYEFYFENEKEQIPVYTNDSIESTDSEKLYVWKLGMNAFSHYKIYEFDSIIVKKDAEYFFIGPYDKISKHEIFDSY